MYEYIYQEFLNICKDFLYLFLQDFLLLLQEKNREMDVEIHFKDTFRAFSKDEDGTLGKIRMLHCGKYLFIIKKTYLKENLLRKKLTIESSLHVRNFLSIDPKFHYFL